MQRDAERVLHAERGTVCVCENVSVWETRGRKTEMEAGRDTGNKRENWRISTGNERGKCVRVNQRTSMRNLGLEFL